MRKPIEEGDKFGDSYNELEAYPEATILSDNHSTVEDPDKDDMEELENIHMAVLKTKNSTVPQQVLFQKSTTSRLSKIIKTLLHMVSW